MRRKTVWLMACIVAAVVGLVAGCGTTAKSTAETSVRSQTLSTFTSGEAGFFTHSHYLDTGDEVIVFDAQFTPGIARALLEEIRSETDSPVTHVVVTHPNPDKFNGATVFQQAGAKLVASRETAEAMKDVHAYKKYYFTQIAGSFSEETYPSLPEVDVTFEDTLTLGDGAVELRVLEHSGVSVTQTVAHFRGAGALIVGDLVHHGAHAWLEGGIVSGQPRPDLAAWREALDELKAYEGATVYGGRGDPAPVAEAVAEQKAYLSRAGEIVADYVAEDPARAKAIRGDEAQNHHRALARRIKEAFPKRELGFLVDYSIYGLAGAMSSGR